MVKIKQATKSSMQSKMLSTNQIKATNQHVHSRWCFLTREDARSVETCYIGGGRKIWSVYQSVGWSVDPPYDVHFFFSNLPRVCGWNCEFMNRSNKCYLEKDLSVTEQSGFNFCVFSSLCNEKLNCAFKLFFSSWRFIIGLAKWL